MARSIAINKRIAIYCCDPGASSRTSSIQMDEPKMQGPITGKTTMGHQSTLKSENSVHLISSFKRK